MKQEIQIGDLVTVTAQVDCQGEIGEVVEIRYNIEHPYKVQFEDTWVRYSADELESIFVKENYIFGL